MAWELYKLSSGYCSLENSDLEADALGKVLSALEKALGGRMRYNCKFGLDFALASAAVELSIDGARITLGWDNWSGVFIMAWDDDGNSVITVFMRFFQKALEKISDM